MRRFGVEDFLGLSVRVGIGHFVRLHLNRRAVARGDADVAARILDLDGGVGGNLRVQHRRVKVVLGQAEGVEEIVAVVAQLGEPGPQHDSIRQRRSQ